MADDGVAPRPSLPAFRPRVLVVGDTFVDVLAGPLPSIPAWGGAVVSPNPIQAVAGGCGHNVAAALVRLGGRGSAALYSGVGRDAFGQLSLRHMQEVGVPLLAAPCTDEDAPTGVCIALGGAHDRTLVFHSGISDLFDGEALTEERLRSMLPELQHMHVCGYFTCAALRRSLPGLLRRAKACGLTTSLGPNHDASGAWAQVDGLWDRVLPLVDILLPNDVEATAIARTAEDGDWLKEEEEVQDDTRIVGGRIEGVADDDVGGSGDIDSGADGCGNLEPSLAKALDKLAKHIGGGQAVVTRGAKGRLPGLCGMAAKRGALGPACYRVVSTLPTYIDTLLLSKLNSARSSRLLHCPRLPVLLPCAVRLCGGPARAARAAGANTRPFRR
jgi:sugar/nucleoside kinase (ribokinase family)